MTIQEAIESGKPARLPEWNVWLSSIDHSVYKCFYMIDGNKRWGTKGITQEDILATTWEVQACEKHDYITDDVDDMLCAECLREYSDAAEGPVEYYTYYSLPIFLEPILEKKFKEVTITLGEDACSGDASGGPDKAGCDGNCRPIPSTDGAIEELEKALVKPGAGGVDESFNCKKGECCGSGKCECGGDAAGIGTHADYCPKGEKNG